MALLARVKSPEWVDGDTLSAADFVAELNNLVNGLNGTNDISVLNVTATNVTATNVTASANVVVSGKLTVTGDVNTAANVICNVITANTFGTLASLTFNNGVTDGGAVYFDGGTTKYIKENAAGTQMDVVTGGTLAITGITTISSTANVGGILNVVGNVIAGANVAITGNVTISGAGTHSVSTAFANEVFEDYTRPSNAAPGVRGVAISTANSGSFTTTSASNVAVTNMTVTLVTSGRPVFVGLIGGLAGTGTVGVEDTANSGEQDKDASAQFSILRDGSVIVAQKIRIFGRADSSADLGVFHSPSCVSGVDVVTAGTYTYTVKTRNTTTSAGGTVYVTDCYLVAYEL